MPTGWYQIGRTPARVLDQSREPMVLADIGDTISFERIDAADFAELSAEAPNGVGR
jgi:allophanate hydrolase subunit 1